VSRESQWNHDRRTGNDANESACSVFPSKSCVKGITDADTKEIEMDEVKTLTQSKTFWGAIVALGGSALSLGHYTLSPADAAQAVDLISGLASAAGGLVAIYGRVVASKKIGA
jgi:hypothetical protein